LFLFAAGSDRYFSRAGGGGAGGVRVHLNHNNNNNNHHHHNHFHQNGNGLTGGSHHNLSGRLTDCDDIDLPVRCEVCDKPFHDVDQ